MIVDEGEGPAVVLLHGRGGSAGTWRELVPLLAARCRVLVPDDAQDLRAQLEGVERFAVVGEREGADLALDLCLEDDRVDALVLLTPTGAGRRDSLAALEIPVLIFAGEDDPQTPVEVAEQLNEAIPTSTLGFLPGAGHHLVEEAPATVFPMIYEYLRARYLKAPHGHGAEGIVTIQLERKPAWVDAGEEDDE